MVQSKYIIAAFLGFIGFVSIEVIEVGGFRLGGFSSGGFRSGGFRYGGGGFHSPNSGSSLPSLSSSRRAPSIFTSKPSYSFNSNRNLGSWRSSSAVSTSKPSYNSNRNSYGWNHASNNHNLNRIFPWEKPAPGTPKPLPARFQTTRKNNVQQVRTTSKPNYNSNRNGYGWNDGSKNHNSNRILPWEKPAPGTPKHLPTRFQTTPKSNMQQVRATSKPNDNSNRNSYGWNDGSKIHNSSRILPWEKAAPGTPKRLPARFQTTPKSNVQQVRTTSKPNYNSNRWNDGSNNYNSTRVLAVEKPGTPKPPPAGIPTTPRNYVQHNSLNYFVNNYPNSYYNDKNSGTTNALIAGLGGSALGMYLGYQLRNTNRDYYPTYNPDSNKFYPQYSVVHYYHHGDRSIVKDVKVNDHIIKECVNITFCTPNTQPLCLTNGTIYCLAPITAVKRCNDNTTNLLCLNTTLTAPCLNAPYNCNATAPLGNITAQIPCVTNLHVYGDFGTGKLKVHQTTNDGNITTESTHNKDTVNEFCVTIIADPIRQQKEMSNAEFMRYLMKNDKEYQKLKVKLQQTLEKLLSL